MRRVRPYYTVQVTSYGCAPDVRLNDGPLYEEPEGLPGTVEVPANEWLRDGDNTLGFYLQPVRGETDFDERLDFQAVVYVREIDQDKEQRREVTRLAYTWADHGAGQSAPLILRERPFFAALPWPRWPWMSGVPILDRDRALAQLRAEVQAFHARLATGDVDAILAGLRQRDEDNARAYYAPVEEVQATTRQEFASLVSDPSWELMPIDPDRLTLRLFGKGRLARLDTPDGESPLCYWQREPGLTTYLSLVFHRRSRGDWTVCR